MMPPPMTTTRVSSGNDLATGQPLRPFRADDWLLYVQESPSAAGARGFNNGALYREDGTLITSAAQEALVRQRK